MSERLDVDVVVVGGGLAGYATSLAFSRAGVPCVVVEGGPPAREDTFGMILWPTASRTLAWLGVLDEVTDAGASLESVRWFVPQRDGSAADPDAGIDIRTSSLGAGTFLGVLPSRIVGTLKRASHKAGTRSLQATRGWDVERARPGWRLTVRTGEQEVTVATPLLVGADGSGSPLRERLALPASRWRPKRQVIVTAVGGPMPSPQSRQALAAQGAWGCASLGSDHSWLNAVVDEDQALDPAATLRRYLGFDGEPSAAFAGMGPAVTVRPWSMRVPQWATDGAVLMGDAAHGMLPHFGFGGSLTLEDVPVMFEVATEALRTGDASRTRLDQFQQRRRGRVGYGRRASERWAQVLAMRVPGSGRMRDLSMRRLARHPHLLDRFYAELSTSAVPSLSTRLRVGLP